MAGEEEKASGRVIGRQRRDYFGPDNVLCSRWIFGENPFGFVACPGDHLVPLPRHPPRVFTSLFPRRGV